MNETSLWDICRAGASDQPLLKAEGEWLSLAQLLRLAANITPTNAPRAVTAADGAPPFLAALLAAWRDRAPFCPLDIGQKAPDGLFDRLPPGTAHVKLTSGSGGAPKRIAFRADQLLADERQIVATMGLRPDSPNLAVISLTHSYGFSNLALPLLLSGIPMIAAENPLPGVVERELRDATRPVTLPAVPAMWKAWWRAGLLSRDRVALAISAGAPLPVEWEAGVFADSGVKIHNFYGSSECGGIAYDRSEEPRTDATLAGTAVDGVSLSLSDAGFLRVHSPACGTGGSVGDGCFVTTDLAELDGDRVRLLGRGGDVIHIAGRKVSPEAIEAEIRRLPGSPECVVFGTPSPDAARNEEIVAIVSVTDLSPSQLRQLLAESLPAWQLPRHWWVTPDLRVNGRGKISRPEWRGRWSARADG